MDVALVFGCALGAGALALVAPGVVLGATALVLVFAKRRALMAVVCGAGLALGWIRAGSLIAAHEEARSAATARGRCTARGVVVSSPVMVRDALRFDAILSGLRCDGAEHAPLRARLYGGPRDLARGDVVELIADIAPLERFRNAELGAAEPREARGGVVRSGAVLTATVTARGRGPPAYVDRARAHVRSRILATFPPQTQALARALVLGEADIAAEEDAAFRASGMSHLLAVSGTHLVVTVVAAVMALRALLARVPFLARAHDVGRWAAAVGIPLAWAYASFAGASGSAVRAAWMLSVALAARALARHPASTRALGVSLVLGSLADPLAVFDVSFVLSAAATGGLLAVGRPLAGAIREGAPRVVRAVWSTCCASVAASIACAPVLASMTEEISVAGVVANVIAVPVGELMALPLCLLHALLAPLPAAEQGCALAASGALAVLSWLAHAFARLPGLAMPAPTHAQLGAIAVGVAAWLLLRERARAAMLSGVVVALLLLEIDAMRLGAPTGGLRATTLDVGQGDATILDLPDGTAMVIDGGGLVGSPIDVGVRVLAPVLRARRRDRVEVVILSHPHPDHFGGLATGLDAIRVGAFWDTGQGERESVGGGYAALLAMMRARGAPVSNAVCGTHWIGGASVEVLAPCPPSPFRSPNDNSFVVRVSLGARALLFMGDAEHEEEDDLVAHHRAALRADVIKVGHHGSRTSSSPALLDAVRPSVAVVSCGVRNRFGHPSPETLRALAGVRVFRTDEAGAVTVWTDGDALHVSSVDGPRSGR